MGGQDSCVDLDVALVWLSISDLGQCSPQRGWCWVFVSVASSFLAGGWVSSVGSGLACSVLFGFGW